MDNIKCQSGALAVYRQKPAKITGISDGKINITLPDGEQKNVRQKDIIMLHSGAVTAWPLPELPLPDLMEISAMLDNETIDFADFTALVFGSYSPAAAWSAWQLLEDGIYFSGDIVKGVAAKPIAEVTATLEAAAAKDSSRRQREDLIERVRAGALLPEDMQHLRDVENLALGKNSTSGIMRQLNMEQTPEKAHRLLLKLGVWDYWTNPFPVRAGIDQDNPNFPVPDLPDEPRLDLTGMIALAIDDAGNQDPDDAISFADGLLWVHVADVAALVQPGDAVDLEAETRGANLYLPERITHMLPTMITHQLGLGLHEKSPALSFALNFDETGAPSVVKIALSLVRVTRCSYEDAENLFDQEPLRSIAPLLESFRSYRENNGALRIDLPEVKIRVAENNITIVPLPPLRSRELVAEAMTATGHAAAKFAVVNQIPFPFAVQPEPDFSGKPDSLAAMFAARRGCTASSIQTTPGLHSGLGLDPYVRITSPLRRYSDLLAHQQLRQYLSGRQLMPAVEIDGKIAKSDNAAGELRRLERVVNEYWKLVYLQIHPEWQGNAVVVERIDNRVTMILPELAYEYKLRFGGDMELNSNWNAAVNMIDPPGLLAKFNLTQPQ